ncbi:hypothetical protein V5O48_008716, partial [Marasmius crinis-equi]
SDVIHIDAAGTSIVVINSAQAATELLDRRSRIYSSRPPAPMVCDLMGWDWNFGFQPYGNSWRERRRTFLQIFHAKAAKQFEPQEKQATAKLLHRLYLKPGDILSHLHHHAASIVLSVAYGLDIKPEDDPYVAVSEAAIHPLLQALVPGAFLVDSLPWLKYVPAWFPGGGFKRKAEESKKLAIQMAQKPFNDGRFLMVFLKEKRGIPSFISSALGKINAGQDRAKQEGVVRDAAAAMYLGIIATLILAMLFAPEVQDKAHEELDRVIPEGRLPDFTDEESLPYVTAVVKETFRWKNVTPLAVPHYLEVEDEYNGYRIPAKSIVLGNVWAILHDERNYPEPFNFKPERYIVDGKLNFESCRDPTTVAFGFGRRVCPGRYMGYSSVWIGKSWLPWSTHAEILTLVTHRAAIASILKVYKIEKAKDENGNVVEPTYKYLDGLGCIPAPFECSMTPRSAAAEELIKSSE